METVGTAAGSVAPRGIDVPVAVTGGMQLPAGAYDVALRFSVPRAQVVEWHVECPDAQVAVAGQVGETVEQYRAHREAELRKQQAQVAGVTGAVIGALVPSVGVTAEQRAGQERSGGPSASVREDVVIDGAAAGASTVSTIVPAYDVGAGGYVASTRVQLGVGSTCGLRVVADDSTVAATFEVTRIHDVRAEQRESDRIAAAGAVDVRGQVHAQLVAFGADEGARDRRLAAEAEVTLRLRREHDLQLAERQRQRDARDAEQRRQRELKIAIELQVKGQRDVDRQAKVDAQLAVRARLDGVALDTRGVMMGWLISIGADPGRRERIAAERQATIDAELSIREAHFDEQQRREQIQIDLDAQARLERDRQRQIQIDIEGQARAEQDRIRVEAEAARVHAALLIRLRLTDSLVAMGAVVRPPMPELLVESSGGQPFDGAVWTRGHWAWVDLRWQWTAGFWADSVAFSDAGVADNDPRPVTYTETETVTVPAAVTTTATVPATATATATATVPTTATVTVPAPPSVIGVGVSIPLPVIHIHTGHSRPAVRDHRR